LNRHIIGAIEQMKVSKEDAPKSRERRYHDLLSRRYVDRRTNREVARALSVSERTFYRERSNAIEALTRVLADDARRRE
jgi:DNA-directed RNA polymerase specialized sigma subunit